MIRRVARTSPDHGPAAELNLTHLTRKFMLRGREGFVENFAFELVNRVAGVAPGVRLCFVQKTDRESMSLRDVIDFEIDVSERSATPEVHGCPLFTERFIGVAPPGHALCRGELSPARYAEARHIFVTRQGTIEGRIDEVLSRVGLTRRIVATVDTFAAAVALARTGDAMVAVPERHTGTLRAGMFSFALPTPVPEMAISLLWHRRQENDPAHCWMRTVVRETIATGSGALQAGAGSR